MASTLSQADVARLLAEPSPQARLELTGKLAVELDNQRLTESELRIAHDIVRTMAKDVEASVRQGLAQSLRRAARMPHDVAVLLANDIENVALPIIENSSVLTDEDFAALIDKGNPAKHAAIAARPFVSEKISEALIDKAGEKAVAVLMGNNGARITESSLNKAADRFKESALVKDKMVRRESLPPAIAERLVTMVSENLRDYLVRHHELPPQIAADLVLQSRERTVIGLSGRSAEAEREQMIRQMHDNRRLTPSLVLRALCLGDLAFFETAMAVMAAIPVVNARILIYDGGSLAFKSLYAKTTMPPRLLPAIRVALEVVAETPLDGGPNDRGRQQARIVERILTQYQDMSQDDMDYLVGKLGDVLGAAA